MLLLHWLHPLCLIPLFHLLISPLASILLFLFTNIHIFFSPTVDFCHSLSPLLQSLSSIVASTPSALLPPSLRWRGSCHVSPLIYGWDVWAGYSVALLGSNCSPTSCYLTHFCLTFFPPYLIMLLSRLSSSLCLDCSHWCNWWILGRLYKSSKWGWIKPPV